MGKEPLILHPEFKAHCDDVLFACQFRAVAHASEGEHVTAEHERRCAAAISGLMEILESWEDQIYTAKERKEKESSR